MLAGAAWWPQVLLIQELRTLGLIAPPPTLLLRKAGKKSRVRGILDGEAAQDTPFKGFPRPRLEAGPGVGVQRNATA